MRACRAGRDTLCNAPSTLVHRQYWQQDGQQRHTVPEALGTGQSGHWFLNRVLIAANIRFTCSGQATFGLVTGVPQLAPTYTRQDT